ncbi:peptide-methionine (S)-S-oxide reductase [Chitinivorax tropicus]|uniref:Peptide methionine sulfoxide reductase MsrA n=1 Tax=Chitinivorax tropicus TaxID=714531 RepID=A0A840MK87_9PROT|nr:peptide-methionine (S)-S-oxide reductase MsrA [Chitinivorax tropicus]MBB5017915.1 peptide-methionine (S)-S-oxide reductase [Chitinivorax tropicus]
MTETIVLGGGCFWCLEAVFQRLKGVHQVTSGYIGGHVDHPSYREVCDGQTGHAEAVRIEFDPAVISYAELLTVFFQIHDPTTRNRQGNDVGTQYRSAIFYMDASQQAQAAAIMAQLEADNSWGAPIVTELTAASTFHAAEPYHHNYYNQHQIQPYCQLIISPKVNKVIQQFAHLLK